ncbi:aspartate/glutamate racemase family protein [Anaerotruncus rubiinfantis]|uniref:aspartate/glutamate racemase family protein n=1 Tax=Anaerotruncus rubiinfantis TaxID=1720200 RepID=UPI00082956AF|nr:aspartate/glutamate racemase family protein [Anaerotruncus rubiinfantis]
MGKIAILHTTSATIAPLTAMLKEACPGAQIENFADDSILPMLIQDENTLPYALEKLLCYARFAERQQAQVILSACSSVGEFKQFAAGKISVPIVRIDDPVSDLAATRGGRILVLATLPSTLRPSCGLLRGKAKPGASVEPLLVEDAYQALISGDKPLHDQLIAKAAADACEKGDVVFLAQASMADAARQLPKAAQEKILFSTGPAVEAVAALYQRLNAEI